ncbi:MAG: hypothetical protein HY910_11670 [Desulfarculus sp.]|nr:hypothetical protein [Desulfarculus sp.]
MDVIIELILCWIFGLLEGLGEALFQLVIELLAEGVQRIVSATYQSRKPVNHALAFVGYIIYGALAGFISLLFVPHLFIKNETLRMANLLVTPVACGLMMVAIGIVRKRRGQALVGLDTFINGTAFALAMALVRYIWRG